MRDPELEVPVSAAHIRDLLDSVLEQLAEIRMWADQLIPRKEDDDGDDTT